MRLFGSVRIPGFGRLSPRIGVVTKDLRRSQALSNGWFWLGFFGTLYAVWKFIEWGSQR